MVGDANGLKEKLLKTKNRERKLLEEVQNAEVGRREVSGGRVSGRK